MDTLRLIWDIFSILTVSVVIIWVAVFYILKYVNSRVTITISTDIPLSMKNNTLYVNCFNVDRHKEIWEAHESDLKIYAIGMEIPAIFYKVPTIKNGYKIAYNTSLSNQQILAIVAATKYDKFELSHDNGYTKVPVKKADDKEAELLISKLMKITEKFDYAHSVDFYKEITSTIDEEFSGEIHTDNRVVSQINPLKSTQDSLRFEANIHDEHMFHDQGWVPAETKFYYIYDGDLYPFDVKYRGKINNMYKWDLTGHLTPGSVYVGFSYSIDGGNKIMPSTTFYGITRTENNEIIDLATAKLGKPEEGRKAIPLWTQEDALDYLSKPLIKKTLDFVIKKHHEDQFDEDFVSLSRINDFWSEYEWLPFTLDDLLSDK